MFDSIVCLNVDKRFDERERISREFGVYGLSVNYFLCGLGEIRPFEEYDHLDELPQSFIHEYPWLIRVASYNAFLCFKKIIFAAKQDPTIRTLLILEDDVTLTPNFQEVVGKAWSSLPSDWKLFYLGANHTWGRTEDVTPNLLKLNGGSQCWHAVCVNRDAFDTIISLPMYSPIDDMCARYLQPSGCCYAAWPNIALQKPGFSHCDNKNQDYSCYFNNKGRRP